MGRRDVVQRAIQGIYSKTADSLYERLVVRGSFPLLGGDLNDLVFEQGRRAVATAAGRPILDMPIGTGYFALAAARRHTGIVVGTDIAEGMVAKASREARAAGVSNLAVVQADAHHLPFATGAFGSVLCSNGLPVIPGLHETVEELARVLAPGGRLYVSALTLPLARALPDETAERLPTMLKSRREIARALTQAGVELTSITRNRLALLFEATKPAS